MMNQFEQHIEVLKAKRQKATIQVQTLGNFQIWLGGLLVPQKEWGRDKTVQLFQFFVTARHRKALHKEQIMWSNYFFIMPTEIMALKQ